MDDKYIVVTGNFASHEFLEPKFGQALINKETGLFERTIFGRTEYEPGEFTYVDESQIIFPPFSDIHIHAREDITGKQNYKEDFTSSNNAALNGGVSHVCPMPNTPDPLTTLEQLHWAEDRIEQLGLQSGFTHYFGIGKNTKPITQRTVPYKLFTAESVGSLFCRNSTEVREYAKNYHGEYVSFHVEDFPIIEKSKNGKTHSQRRPEEAIYAALEYVLDIIEEFELKAKLCHWPVSGRSFDMIDDHRERMRQRGLERTTIEASALHLLYSTEILEEKPWLWPFAQMNPALRNEKNRLGLIAGLKDGTVDFIANDHAPHTIDEKLVNFTEDGLRKKLEDGTLTNLSNQDAGVALDFMRKTIDLNQFERYQLFIKENPHVGKLLCQEHGTSGAPWLDTFSDVCTLLMEKYNFTSQDIARITAYNPGQFLKNFGIKRGEIKPLQEGSFTVLNTNKPHKIIRSDLQTKCAWSLLEIDGVEFPGGLDDIIIKGKRETGQFKKAI